MSQAQWIAFFVIMVPSFCAFWTAASPNCISDNYLPQSPNSIYGFNSTNITKLYPDLESFLQIYKQFKFRCNGWLKGIVLYPAHNEIKGVNIGIFRIDPQDGLLILVNSTSIKNVIPPLGNRTWFYYDFPKPIQGIAGDYIGIYYDNWRTVAGDLAIRTAALDSAPWIGSYATNDTMIFRLDSRLIAPGASLDMELAEIRKRVPAMAVLIVPNQPTTRPPNNFPATLPRQCSMDVLPDDINCANTSLRFRYSPSQMRCYEFLGCDTMATSNNFPSARGCLALCLWPFTTTPSPVSPGGGGGSVEGDPRCSQQLTVDDTDCDSATVERWNFNQFYRQCRPFLGCDRGRAIGNNWDSEYQCEASCVQGNSTGSDTSGDARCFSESTLGQWLCLYKEPRYYWDKEASTCKQFYGCPYRNNMGYPIGNNFGSYAGCIAGCAPPTTPEAP